jgi:hypothetical protein
MWKRYILCLTFITILFAQALPAQEKPATAAEALSLYKSENYEEAARMYSTLLERNDRDLTSNYYYGVCLFKLNLKTDEALRRLKFSSTRPVSNDLYYYLGRLYQQIYEMELAIENLERFLKQAKPEDSLTLAAQNALEDSRSGLRLINKSFDVKIIGKDTIQKSDLLQYYHLQKEGGEIMAAGDFFRTGVDPDQVIFKTERGDEVYFSIQEVDETWNIYKIVRLLDTWNEADDLGEPVNTQWDELYPFLLTDGITLYFSSNRPGGMGGFDLYQSFFDPETREFSPPSNLGPPFNSPGDDFLLVPDVLNGNAWFATNRGLPNDQVVVVELVWDQTVIKNNTESIHQLRTLASLPLSPDVKSKSSSTLYASRDITRKKVAGEFRFMVNDTLVYTRFDQFHSQEALAAFRTGHKTELKKDSLTNLMALKRKTYAQSYNKDELKSLIDEIVLLEKQTYSLEEDINPHYQNARRYENQRIKQLVNQGAYRPKTGATSTQKPKTRRSELAKFNLKDFSFYSEADFQKRTQALNNMYANFFTTSQTASLQQADTSFLWADILSLESAKILEQTRNLAPTTVNPLQQLMNHDQEEAPENPELVALIHKSRDMKRLSLDLYDEGLNTKYNIYYPVAVEFNSTSKQTGSEYMLNQASSNFRKAEEGKATTRNSNTEAIERLLALKKHSVGMLEESFMIQTAGVVTVPVADNGERFFDAEPAITPSYPLLQKGAEGIRAENQPKPTPPAEVVSKAFSTGRLEYRIQIGVFRNSPNPAALAKIPAVTSLEVPLNGVSKYYSGSWNNYAEAQAAVPSIREAGFPGAFVVAFVNGVPETVEKARLMEGQ